MTTLRDRHARQRSSRSGRREPWPRSSKPRGARRRDRRHQDRRRPAAGGAALRGRRQAAVRQGNRGRAARRGRSTSRCTARRTCRRCCRTDSTSRAVLPREDPRDALVLRAAAAARISRQRLLRLEGDAVDRHRQRASHRAVARCPAACPVSPAFAATSIRACGSSTTGDYDALVLAAAGHEPARARGRIAAHMPLDVCVPAPGQGIIAVEMRVDDEVARRAWPHADDRRGRRIVGG